MNLSEDQRSLLSPLGELRTPPGWCARCQPFSGDWTTSRVSSDPSSGPEPECSSICHRGPRIPWVHSTISAMNSSRVFFTISTPLALLSTVSRPTRRARTARRARRAPRAVPPGTAGTTRRYTPARLNDEVYDSPCRSM